MTDTPPLLSKVLVLDGSSDCTDDLKLFCEQSGLLPLKVNKTNLMAVLASNIDLGAVLFSEDYAESFEASMAVARDIHHARRELPIFLRRESTSPSLDDLPRAIQKYFCSAYSLKNLDHLRHLVDEYIFCLVYPSALVHGIRQITEDALASQFKGMSVLCDPPYVVRDRLIYGELFSLMSLESSWCKGYMMFQIQESPILYAIKVMNPDAEEVDFRDVNSMLGEITNLVWGHFRNRYVGEPPANQNRVQVPIIINHQHKHISFGTENPQLCLHYTLTNESNGLSFEIYQRFIFNLSWSPEDFKENPQEIEEFVSSGDLEFF